MPAFYPLQQLLITLLFPALLLPCCSLRANRNITITGPEGRNAASADVMPVIDLMHLPGILELCATCHFVFAFVNIAHGERRHSNRGVSTSHVSVCVKLDQHLSSIQIN